MFSLFNVQFFVLVLLAAYIMASPLLYVGLFYTGTRSYFRFSLSMPQCKTILNYSKKPLQSFYQLRSAFNTHVHTSDILFRSKASLIILQLRKTQQNLSILFLMNLIYQFSYGQIIISVQNELGYPNTQRIQWHDNFSIQRVREG